MYLPAGDVVFDEIGVLEAKIFDREAVFEVADHPARGLPMVTAVPMLGRWLWHNQIEKCQ